MKKLFFSALVLVPALAFALGLRLDLKALADAWQKKPDHNAEALRKMGIDPGQIDFKGKSWWTFDPEDNLFKKIDLRGWDPVKKMSDQAWDASQTMKKNLGGNAGGDMQAQAQLLAARARLNAQRAAQEMQEAGQ